MVTASDRRMTMRGGQLREGLRNKREGLEGEGGGPRRAGTWAEGGGNGDAHRCVEGDPILETIGEGGGVAGLRVTAAVSGRTMAQHGVDRRGGATRLEAAKAVPASGLWWRVEEVWEMDAGVKRGAAMPMVATVQRGDGESGG
uniref:DUF834 domain-containing protein n=1 Tax=Oryza sativa subsp. japonica TaxID=39947 RepID=Q6K3Z1_ORYSJ|nr:hypothetical protein [Oryza sativa Japonica Group]